MANQHLQNLMQKQVSRKEFMGILGLAAVSVLGFGYIIKILTGKSLDTRYSLNGYEGSVYGGKDKKL